MRDFKGKQSSINRKIQSLKLTPFVIGRGRLRPANLSITAPELFTADTGNKLLPLLLKSLALSRHCPHQSLCNNRPARTACRVFRKLPLLPCHRLYPHRNARTLRESADCQALPSLQNSPPPLP